jgi:2-polyprenyl-6-methoxyphenol hydroxylase-like FAD-dependent oxidoreductase
MITGKVHPTRPIHRSQALLGYEADGKSVRVHFADGREAEADVLVGADGVNSAVRRQYLPAAEPADTGGRCVYGKTPLRPAALELLPAALDAGFTAVIGGRLGMATGLVRFRNRPEQLAGIRLSAAEDYLMWGLAADRGQFGVPGERLLALSPAELHAAELIRGWHPDLRALHAMADIEETFAVRIRTSPAIAAWQPSRVTVLGDAIHAMSPAAGSGANTALRDAAQLCRALTTTADGDDITWPSASTSTRCAITGTPPSPPRPRPKPSGAPCATPSCHGCTAGLPERSGPNAYRNTNPGHSRLQSADPRVSPHTSLTSHEYPVIDLVLTRFRE